MDEYFEIVERGHPFTSNLKPKCPSGDCILQGEATVIISDETGAQIWHDDCAEDAGFY